MQPQTLKTILGHSSLSMTMDLYAHVLPDTKAKDDAEDCKPILTVDLFSGPFFVCNGYGTPLSTPLYIKRDKHRQ